MKEFVLHNDMSVDPLTGLDNFIKFINEDFGNMMGDNGTILIFDIAQFKIFNDEFGRQSGDKVIICISSILSNIFKGYRIFRTEGDAFTVVMKGYNVEYITKLLNKVQYEFRESMKINGYSNINLHQIIYSYNKQIKSIEEYYMFIINEDGKRDITNKFEGDKLIEHIIKGIIMRFKQSIFYYNEVYNYALIDEVSELPNAKAARQQLSSLLVGDSEAHNNYAVLFIDGDDLRRYNDISYQTGNDMIRKMGSVIKQSIRNNDKVFRWLSGDEFLVILEDVDEQMCINLVERIRENMVESRDNFIFPTTISIGVSYYPTDGTDFDELVKKAEKANKEAKDSGKNKVIKWRSA